MTDNTHPPRPTGGPLAPLWDLAEGVRKLVELELPDDITPERAERHRIYGRLLMALVVANWNGNKRGQAGTYPWRERQRSGDRYLGGDYLGHNIGAFAVDGKGEIIDFDFNHNEILRSSVEHAESRLIRRIFGLTQIYDGWATATSAARTSNYANLLSDVTIYTSLESCSQCSGIMALGSVKEVVYLHRDPGQNSIGNILRNLAPVGGRYVPPMPIPGDLIGIEQFQQLSTAYSRYLQEVPTREFWQAADGSKDNSPAITSFLCTDDALDIFRAGAATFVASTPELKSPDFAPSPGVMTNAQVFEHARRFYAYATTRGFRGTPHRL